ncbi:MAG: tRNA uridine-5-carboxymethylaminomethyl(34) synthesis GTPase MnmE [Lachnospiraceae bacterium]|nr:tRNA uridine-5-carboxymethylaminomethyl(34) synthesis GTPase MnmE [Lachnospiraceae bacterium]
MGETIAAIASGMTASGIGIIRISGPEAFAVLESIFLPRTAADVQNYKTNTIHYGWIKEYNGKCSRHQEQKLSMQEAASKEAVIDEVLVMIMRAPHTYTTEDTVEIDCHGGPYVMKRILEAVIAAGARPAEPGEFTKRAFLGGRIDLSEAEAVMDVIGSRSEDALKSSLMQLSGSVRRAISGIRTVLMDELAYIEAALDDPEHMDLTGYPEELAEKLQVPEQKLKELAATFDEGKMIRNGILTVILGKPNAGKSSLLNALTGEDRAIVTDIEGTTRDILEEQIELGGLSLRIIDTAGIRDNSGDAIEQIGIERARKYAADADLLLAVFDAARPLDDNDCEILQIMQGRKAIAILNKSDLPPVVKEEELQKLAGAPVVRISAKELTGLTQMEEYIRNMFFSGKLDFNEETVITNIRHRDALMRSVESIRLVRESIENGLPEDFYSIDLMDAYRSLGEILGEEVSDDLVNTIFAKFCMGK